ncbi:MAG: type II toxin-antitoxin system RelE/ParE family toxin [Roseburia sp.]|nr:type II toxin-antitoxin system RelE/ParE family toxin [Roseburia sp.]
MTYKVEMTEQAETDLREIYEYIASTLLSPENASGQLDRLEAHIVKLGEFPEKFRRYEKEPWNGRGMRVMPVDNYLVFYVPDKEVALVTVIRVIYAGRDVDAQLSEHTVL